MRSPTHFSLDGAWGTWVGRWTAEENRHGIAIRDYLVVTRAVDPVALEQARMEHMTNGFAADAASRKTPIADSRADRDRVRRHSRNWPPGSATATPARCATTRSPIGCCSAIAADENLHMIFYRN